jgi:hypothetical protein
MAHCKEENDDMTQNEIEYVKLCDGAWVARFNGRDFMGRVYGSRGEAEQAVLNTLATLKAWSR